jgi:hypothetical protein
MPGSRAVLCLDHPLGLLGDLALDVLPLAVEGVELRAVSSQKALVLAQQQLDRERGVGQPAAGVDARPEPEGNVTGMMPCSGFTPATPSAPQARAARLLQDAQARAARGCGSRRVSGTRSATVPSATRSR